MAVDESIDIVLVYSPAERQVHETSLQLPAGSSVLQALQAAGWLQRFPNLDPATLAVGIWGQRVTLQQTLQPGDRLELYRPLKIDPKQARRKRFAQQGARAAGLFAKKNKTVKTGR